MGNQKGTHYCTKGIQKRCAAVQGADSGETHPLIHLSTIQIHLFPVKCGVQIQTHERLVSCTWVHRRCRSKFLMQGGQVHAAVGVINN